MAEVQVPVVDVATMILTQAIRVNTTQAVDTQDAEVEQVVETIAIGTQQVEVTALSNTITGVKDKLLLITVGRNPSSTIMVDRRKTGLGDPDAVTPVVYLLHAQTLDGEVRKGLDGRRHPKQLATSLSSIRY